MLKLTTDRNEASRGLFATAELLVVMMLSLLPFQQSTVLDNGYSCRYDTFRIDWQ